MLRCGFRVTVRGLLDPADFRNLLQSRGNSLDNKGIKNAQARDCCSARVGRHCLARHGPRRRTLCGHRRRPGAAGRSEPSIFLRHKWGYDVDAVFGYDFGMFRVEGEFAYKRAQVKNVLVQDTVLHAVLAPGIGVADFNSDGNSNVLSGMINGLIDLGPQDAFNLSVGAGVGEARARYRAGLVPPPNTVLNFTGRDNALAWQALAEVRVPIATNIDVGVKYRHFETGKLKFGTFCQTTCTTVSPYRLSGRYTSNSFMASLVYNFWSPPPPPPPPRSAASRATRPLKERERRSRRSRSAFDGTASQRMDCTRAH